MRVEGTYSFQNASRDAVWDSLTNPDRIAECLPGCDKLEQIEEHGYRMNIRVGIGAIRSSYTGTVHLKDLRPTSAYTLKVLGTGASGFMEGEGSVQLDEDGDVTRVRYTGNVSVGGKIAAVGQRMVGGAARMVIGQFFKCVGSRMGE